jgi:Golgin subfamily A member 7/ERF4 family
MSNGVYTFKIPLEYKRCGPAQFSFNYPAQLRERVTEQQFRSTVAESNRILRAWNSQGWCNLGLFLFPVCCCVCVHKCQNHRALKDVKWFLRRENQRIYLARGVQVELRRHDEEMLNFDSDGTYHHRIRHHIRVDVALISPSDPTYAGGKLLEHQQHYGSAPSILPDIRYHDLDRSHLSARGGYGAASPPPPPLYYSASDPPPPHTYSDEFEHSTIAAARTLAEAHQRQQHRDRSQRRDEERVPMLACHSGGDDNGDDDDIYEDGNESESSGKPYLSDYGAKSLGQQQEIEEQETIEEEGGDNDEDEEQVAASSSSSSSSSSAAAASSSSLSSSVIDDPFQMPVPSPFAPLPPSTAEQLQDRRRQFHRSVHVDSEQPPLLRQSINHSDDFAMPIPFVSDAPQPASDAYDDSNTDIIHSHENPDRHKQSN